MEREKGAGGALLFWKELWARARLAHPLRGIGAGTCGEDDGLVAVQKDPVMDMGVDRAAEHVSLHIAAEADVIIGGLGMGDAHRILFDDRALVEIGGDVALISFTPRS